MAAVKAMAMGNSSSEESYAQNSGIQNQNFHGVAKPMLSKAVEQLLSNFAAHPRKHIAIADLGCSYGRNTLDCAEFILGALQQNWACADQQLPEIQYFFSDLPSNDFNALFQSLQPYLHHPPNSNSVSACASASEAEIKLPQIYAAGVPGSFHGRLFPSASLDLVVCSYSLHWLSQVPPSIVEKSSPAWNGGHTWIYKASKDVLDAYALQSHMDVTNFLRSRTHELVSGGVLFLFLGSMLVASNETSSNYDDPALEIYESAWKEMVDEGLITTEEWDTFNMPMYSFNERELKNMLTDVPEFKLLHIESINKQSSKEKFTLHQWIEIVTSATKPTVETHLGKEKSKELFKKLNNIGSKKNGLMDNLSHNVLVACLQRL